MKLGENLKVIYGTQPLRGKILSRKNLGPIDQERSTSIRTREEKLILLPEIIEGNGIATARPECSDNGLPPSVSRPDDRFLRASDKAGMYSRRLRIHSSRMR
jgi:hypothetical protein